MSLDNVLNDFDGTCAIAYNVFQNRGHRCSFSILKVLYSTNKYAFDMRPLSKRLPSTHVKNKNTGHKFL